MSKLLKLFLKYNRFLGIFFILSISYLIIIHNGFLFSESQKSWYAEHLFSENYRFLNFTFGPLYLLYLKLIRCIFDYPNFIVAELVITSSLYLIFFYNLTKIFFSNLESFLITISNIPLIILIESRQNLLASSFLILYLIMICKKKITIFPLSLAIASLITRTYFLLLVIHVFINLIFLKKKIKLFNKNLFTKENYIKFILLAFFVYSFSFQLKDNINNHMLVDTTYMPNINHNNPVEVGFFQFNNQRLSSEKGFGSEDWYFTFRRNYNDNNSIYKVALNQPRTLIEHIIKNIPSLIFQINKIIYGPFIIEFYKFIKVILCAFILYIYYKSLIILSKEKLIIYLPTIFFVLIFFTTLLTVNPTGRYVALLLPVYILPFYTFLKKYLKKRFVFFLLVYSSIIFFSNYHNYKNIVKENFIKTADLAEFLKKLKFEKKILTNQKNLLSTIDNNKKFYLGFDSLPPFFDQKILVKVSKMDLIIFTEEAKSNDDISIKTGMKFTYYVEPFLRNNNWTQKKIDNFIILEKK